MLYWLVLAVHVVVSLFLILVVLLQSGKGGDIASAFGGAGTQTVFGPRAAGNVLSRATTWSAAVFMVTSLALVWLSQAAGTGSVMGRGAGAPPPQQSAPAAPAPTEPAPGTPETAPPADQPVNPPPAQEPGATPEGPK